jgi:hypothetical protein
MKNLQKYFLTSFIFLVLTLLFSSQALAANNVKTRTNENKQNISRNINIIGTITSVNASGYTIEVKTKNNTTIKEVAFGNKIRFDSRTQRDRNVRDLGKLKKQKISTNNDFKIGDTVFISGKENKNGKIVASLIRKVNNTK